jgi:GTPase KRas protein
MSGEGFLLVFAINDKASFQEIKQLRESIVNLRNTSRVPFVLVGNKAVHTRVKLV